MDPDYLFASVLPDLKRWVSSYGSLPTTEIEVSFKNLTNEDFVYLDHTLSAYDGWDEVKTSSTIDQTFTGSSVRKTIDKATGKASYMVKRRIEPPMDMALGDVDFRFQLKEEVLRDSGPPEEPLVSHQRTKDRKTFTLGKLAYDLTCVNGATYEFEIECLDGCSADELVGHVLLISNKLNIFRMDK